jgi:glycosyltransferase involved in cell wall biosynthesis
MNVGIMVSSQTPQAGGGFTFEDEILEAFFRLRSESAHRFFLVGYARERPAHLDHTGLGWLSLHRSRALRRKEKLSRLWRKAGRKLKFFQKKPALDFEAYPSLQKQPLDLICYLTPLIRPVADIPYITTVWDLEHRVKPFFPEVGLRGEWESRERRYREVLPRAAYILALNRRGKKEVVDLYGVAEERVRALTLPTPGFALREGSLVREKQPQAHLGLKGDYLFYPAQFWAHKNHPCLLLALKFLKEKHDYKPQLVLTGSDKGNRSHVEQMVRDYALQDQVLFAGFVSREDLTSLYRQALALVYPSFFGPENLPTLEAFALGCPVIASAIPGHEEQLSDAALLVDPTRPELWAETIWRLRQDEALRDAQVARGKVRALHYTPDHYATDLLKIVDEFAAYRRCWAVRIIS